MMTWTLNMKRTVTTVLVVVGLLVTSAAAGPWGGEGKARHGRGDRTQKLEKLKTELALTPEQSQQIATLMESHRREMTALREKMKSTLTPEQQAQMESWKQNRGRGERPSREAMKAKMDELGLSDAQRQQMKSYRQQIRGQRESLRQQISAVLTPEQQAQLEAKMQARRGGDRPRRGPGRGTGN